MKTGAGLVRRLVKKPWKSNNDWRASWERVGQKTLENCVAPHGFLEKMYKITTKIIVFSEFKKIADRGAKICLHAVALVCNFFEKCKKN